jgi:tetratricopeptide (TPR) repeat protein
MALLLFEQGKYRDTEPYARRALDGWTRVRGEDTPETLKANYVMGIVLHRVGRHEQGVAHVRKAYEGQLRVLPKDHPDTLESMFRVGYILMLWERVTEASPWIDGAVADMRRVLGDNHPATLDAIGFQGITRHHQGRNAEAVDILTGVLPRMHRELGDDSWKVWTYEANLCATLHQLGRLDEAAPRMEAAYANMRRLRGQDHHHTLLAATGLARLRLLQGRFGDAEEHIRDCLLGRQRHGGGPSEEINIAWLWEDDKKWEILIFARVLEAAGKSAEADDVRDKFLKSATKPERTPSETARGLMCLAWNYWLANRLTDAEPLARRAVEGFRAAGSNFLSYSMGMLASVLRDMGRPAEALPLFEEAAREFDALGEPLHQWEYETRVRHAECLLMLDRFADAERQLTALAARLSAEGHPTPPVNITRCLIKVYAAWHAVEPGAGHDIKAARLRESLPPCARDADPPPFTGDGG